MRRTQTPPRLGRGIYRVADVCRYTRVPRSTVHSWFKSSQVLTTDYLPTGDTFSVSFYDLMDTLVAYQFRKLGVRMSVVRKAYTKLAATLQTAHPFCHKKLYTDGKSIIVHAAQELGTGNLQDAVSNQQLFVQIQEHLANVAYSVESELADLWRIAEGVIINPAIGMGHPVLEGTALSTFVVRNSYRANGGKSALVADMFNVTPRQVLHAVKFEDKIRSAA